MYWQIFAIIFAKPNYSEKTYHWDKEERKTDHVRMLNLEKFFQMPLKSLKTPRKTVLAQGFLTDQCIGCEKRFLIGKFKNIQKLHIYYIHVIVTNVTFVKTFFLLIRI